MSKLLLAAGMALICGTAAWGKNNVPDFRYPETVINDATKQIEKADKKGNHKALVDGLVLACSIIFAIVYVADMAVFTPSFLKTETFLGLETVATARFTWNIFFAV